VTKFELDESHFAQYCIENVGAEMHNELWVPAASLEVFNQNISGKIEIVKVFYGNSFVLPSNELMRSELLKFYK